MTSVVLGAFVGCFTFIVFMVSCGYLLFCSNYCDAVGLWSVFVACLGQTHCLSFDSYVISYNLHFSFICTLG